MKIIPWKYKDINFVKSWEWETAHFTASVRSDGERFFYMVLDKTQGLERSIASGDSLTFEESETFIKEAIGKSYPPRLGYQPYTGSAGTSFRIYTGEVVNFQEFDGSIVVIEAIGKNEEKHSFTGTLRLSGHDIFMYPDSKTKIKVPPSFIYKIYKEDGRRSNTLQQSSKVGTTRDIKVANTKPASRTVPGKRVTGCTGIDGFKVGTVSHPPNAAYCPIHKV